MWCRQRDFGVALHKSERQRRKEIDRHREDTSRAALSRGRRHRNTIVAIFEGDLAVDDLRTDSLRTVAEHARRLQATPLVHTAFRDLLLVAERADHQDLAVPARQLLTPATDPRFASCVEDCRTANHHRLLTEQIAEQRPGERGGLLVSMDDVDQAVGLAA